MRGEFLIQENLAYAEGHARAGNTQEAALLYQAVLLVDADNERARAGLDENPPEDPLVLRRTLLGQNRVRAIRRKSPWLWVGLYPVNRVLDLFDVVSFQVGLQGGVYAGAHATRAAQVAVGAAGGMQLGWMQKRELYAGSGHISALALGPFSVESEKIDRAGTRGLVGGRFRACGLNRPTDLGYQRGRDYWAIGARAVAVIVGAEVQVHPVEIADAVAGFFFIDFLRDDLGRTRRLKLRAGEIEAMDELLGTLSAAEWRACMRGRMPAPKELFQSQSAETPSEHAPAPSAE